MRHGFLLNPCIRPGNFYAELSHAANSKLFSPYLILGINYNRPTLGSLLPHAVRWLHHKSQPSSTNGISTKRPASQRLLQAKAAAHAWKQTKRRGIVQRGVRLVLKGSLSAQARMRSHIQFITTPTSDTPGTALMLHFDDKRYVFGQVHEGLQRAALQSGARFLKAKNFFLTGRTEWRNTGGMLGMILTLADGARAAAASKAETARLRMERKKAREEAEAQRNGKKYSRSVKSNGSFSQKPSKDTMAVEVDPTVRIHGGPNLLHTLATARSFVFRQGTPIEVKEFDEEQCGPSEEKVWKPTFMDNRIQVWAMHIRPISDAAPSPPVSPRKRSLDEYIFDEKNLRHYTDCERPTAEQVAAQWGIHTSQPKSNSQSDQQIRHTAVTEMFNSKWRFDNLVEKPLSQVKLPAAMFVRDPKTKKLARYEGPIPVANKPTPNIQVLVRQPWPGSLIDHLPPTQSSPVAMSYIVRNHRQRGRFKAEEAKRLNVPPGTLFAELAQGLSVTSTDGNIITPDMVLEPSKDGGGVAIFDLPSIDYIPALFQRPELVADAVMTGVGSFIWILGPGVAQDERLLRFMEEFKDMEHIVSSSDVCANVLTMTTAAIESLRHGQIDSDRFPHLHRNDSSPNQESFVKNSNLPLFRSATRGLKIQLEPKLAVVEDEIPRDLDKLQAQSEIPPKVFEFAEQARKDIATETAQIENAKQDLPSPSAEIVCLGTGSALPSLHRNVSATLLRVPGYGSYLLDCGENTLGQLRRMYTPAKLREVLGDLKLIWISHLHADHHLGTTSVIKAWYDAVHGEDAIKRPKPSSTDHLLHPETLLENGRRLFVVGHPYMIRWLDEYSSVEDFGYDQIVPLQATYKQDNTSDQCMLKWNGVDVGFNSSNNPRM